MAKTTNSNYKCRKYSFGGGVAVGSILGGYLGYKIGRARPQKAGFETEKKLGRKIKETAKDVRGKRKTQKMGYGGRTRRYYGRTRQVYNNDPRIISSRFDTTCAETGKAIRKGEKCVYYPKGRECFSMDSKQAQGFNEYMSDLDMGFDYSKGGGVKRHSSNYVYIPMATYRGDMLRIGSAYTTLDEAKDWIRKREQESSTGNSDLSIETMLKEPKEQVYSIEKIDEKALHFSYAMQGNYAYIIIETKLEKNNFAKGGSTYAVKPHADHSEQDEFWKEMNSDKMAYGGKLTTLSDEDIVLVDTNKWKIIDTFPSITKAKNFGNDWLEEQYDKGNKDAQYGVMKYQGWLKQAKIYFPNNYAEGGGVKSSNNYRIGDRIIFNSYRNGTSKGEIIRELDEENYEVGSGMGMSMVNKSEIIGLQETPRFSLFEQGGNIDDIIKG